MLDLDRFEESPHLLDILLQMEDVLDSMDLYVFTNWFSGEVVEGPNVHRYWLGMVLRFPLNKMPDPRGAKRLLKQNVLVEYAKVTVADVPDRSTNASDSPLTDEQKAEEEKPTHWEVTIDIPRRLVSDMNAAELDFYDEDVDVEDVQDAQDSGMNDESGYVDTDGGDDNMAPADPNAPTGQEDANAAVDF